MLVCGLWEVVKVSLESESSASIILLPAREKILVRQVVGTRRPGCTEMLRKGQGKVMNLGWTSDPQGMLT